MAVHIEDPKVDLVEAEGERRLQVTWTDNGVAYAVLLMRVGHIPRLLRFVAEAEGGLPARPRHFPSDTDVVDAVRRLGPTGATYLAWLLEATFHHEGDLASITSEVVEASLDRFQRDVAKRSPQAPELIDLARKLLDEGHRTNEVVSALVAEGVSTATAFRRIKDARQGEQHLV